MLKKKEGSRSLARVQKWGKWATGKSSRKRKGPESISTVRNIARDCVDILTGVWSCKASVSWDSFQHRVLCSISVRVKIKHITRWLSINQICFADPVEHTANNSRCTPIFMQAARVRVESIHIMTQRKPIHWSYTDAEQHLEYQLMRVLSLK